MTRMECIEAMNKYANMVMRIALNYCKNKYDAEDITQDVFCKLISLTQESSKNVQNVLEFNDEEHLKRWLIRVTINQCKSMLITPWHKKTQFLEDVNKQEGVYEQNEKSNLYECVMKLPRKYRIPIYLHYYEGYLAKEIAEMLDIKEDTVRAQLMRGRNMLKKNLKEDESYEYSAEV